MQRLEAGFQFADDLAHACRCVFVLEYLCKIELGRAEEVHQCPGRAPGFEEYIVNFEPRGLDDDHVALRIGCRCRRIEGQVFIDPGRRNTVAEPPRQAAESLLNLCQPFAKVVGTGVKLRIEVIVVGESVAVAFEALDSPTVFGFGLGEDPRVVVDEKRLLGIRDVGVFL